MEQATVELDGYGYGYGSGYGYGDGYGYGYGSQDETASAVYFKALLDKYQRGANIFAFWRSNADGTPSNGGSKTKASVGLTEEVDGPLRLCSEHALHGTHHPHKWNGDRWWIAPAGCPRLR